MKCDVCSVEYSKITGSYKFKSRIIGDILIPNMSWLECSICHKKLLSPSEFRITTEYVSKKESEMVAGEPFDEFISIKAAAALLGFTKQAFHKNSRIIRGFILSAEKDGRRYYLRRSVEQFNKSRDGRISLVKEQQPITTDRSWQPTTTSNIVKFRCKPEGMVARASRAQYQN